MRDSKLFAALIGDAMASGMKVRFSAEGTSMHPTIRHGELITVAPVSADDVVPGDVLLCRHDTRVLAHRLVGVTTRGAERIFHLRGDAKSECDAPVSAEELVGRVIFVCRNGRVALLCGRAPRLRHAMRTSASGLKALVRALVFRV